MGQRAVIDDRELTLGNGEIHIAAKGNTVYVAPTMIVHYIIDHQYLPPEAFIGALRPGRVPDLPPEAFDYEASPCPHRGRWGSFGTTEAESFIPGRA